MKKVIRLAESKLGHIIKNSVASVLKESDWNFHLTSGEHNMRPYISDNKYMMAGRETGHFGSGTYFSSYKGDGRMDSFRDGFNPNFIRVSDGIYRVDMDLYKNLYRVRSKKEGDILYTLLTNLNRMANRIAQMGRFSSSMANYNNSDLYQKIRANAEGLGLKCPSYYELTRMAQRLGSDDGDVRSFSTVFMEWNGYNGVNVSGIDYYDNTKHGSVIYDLSKVSDDIKEVNPKSFYTGFKNTPYNDTVVRNGSNDIEIESLMGEGSIWYYRLNSMPLSNALRVLKNYADSGNILTPYELEELDDALVGRYLRFLFSRNPSGYFGNRLCDEIAGDRGYIGIIYKLRAYYWVNYESDKGSILIGLLNKFSMDLDWDLTSEQENEKKAEYLNMLMGYMQRELSSNEKEFIDDYCQ